MPAKYISFIAFLILCVGGGALIGTQNLPGDWYDGLTKPFFNPPSWLFGPVWTVLYAMIAVAGWRTWIRNANGTLMKIWFAQIALNFTWSPVFFTYHWTLFAALIILAMIVLTAIFIVSVWSKDRVAGWLMIPYLCWIGFASLLNISLWWLNFA
ncbi:TspO/MBR family protein [Ahrensia sp. 13_GOM-1096m]|uniref:TspO/MBR family protein n=1 Tax=Ahrensia sp. 13_GOM-1096m TaxID=1380380 RepID=UPI000685075A|nr:TspO/MBR family protein [Ahrensia sp. 13_GOM-1096m]